MYDPKDRAMFNTPGNTEDLLARTPAGRLGPLPDTWWKESLGRLLAARDSLHYDFVGMDDITDWLLASIVARENPLLLGAPGVAKSQLVTRLYDLLDLKIPPKPDPGLLAEIGSAPDPWLQWEIRTRAEKTTQKYFHYLLSRFTQPEELFGPIEISLLRQGLLVRVGFGLLTGPGVRAAFLDEIFKASSSILNTLLTLSQERRFFNWGGMEESDLLFLVGASNELPGAFGGGSVAAAQDDFQELYAFLDRFPVRLLVPVASGSNVPDLLDSNLAKAFSTAFGREINQFSKGAPFPSRDPDMPTVNDLICLGRSILEAVAIGGGALFDPVDLARFRNAFTAAGCRLQAMGTIVSSSQLHWTISPRKLRSLYKIALAHALVRGDGCIRAGAPFVAVGAPQLRVFGLIWDSPAAQLDLARDVDQMVREY